MLLGEGTGLFRIVSSKKRVQRIRKAISQETGRNKTLWPKNDDKDTQSDDGWVG